MQVLPKTLGHLINSPFIATLLVTNQIYCNLGISNRYSQDELDELYFLIPCYRQNRDNFGIPPQMHLLEKLHS